MSPVLVGDATVLFRRCGGLGHNNPHTSPSSEGAINTPLPEIIAIRNSACSDMVRSALAMTWSWKTPMLCSGVSACYSRGYSRPRSRGQGAVRPDKEL